MCTIVATLNENRPAVIRAMTEAVHHRGPDSLEVWTGERHGIGACRLSIFGDPTAKMIYHDSDTGRIILLNGEIYNYTSLWEELASRGIVRKTTLESELIAKLYDVHQLDFASRLKGMFAVVILDGKRLILARDRFGIKPIYYFKNNAVVLVCSEIKGLLKHPSVTPTLNLNALQQSRVFGYVHSQDETLFEGIRQVKPGTVLCLEASGGTKELNYSGLPGAHYQNDISNLDYEECVRETRKRVIAAAEGMFAHGSMDKGVYLSGGLDSSTIALVAKHYLGQDIDTFTLADDEASPDLLTARKVARALGTIHHEFSVDLADYWKWLPDYVAHYESLMAGGVFHIQGGLAFHILSNFVSKHVKVAFSGEGADELFGGYYWIYTHPLGFSDRIRNGLAGVQESNSLKSIVDGIFPLPEDEDVYRKNLFDDLLLGALSNYHLQSVDRSAGAFGFEIRPFYLEDDLAQWAMNLPIDFKVSNKHSTKQIIRDAFREDYTAIDVPEVITRKKVGMPAALHRLDTLVVQAVEAAVPDEELKRHPYGDLLGSKMNLLVFDLFEHIFFHGWDHHSDTPPKGSLLGHVWPE